MKKDPRVAFSEYYKIDKKYLEKSGFFNISLISDIPLFIDPFHLFYSDKKEYGALHDEIIKYLSFSIKSINLFWRLFKSEFR